MHKPLAATLLASVLFSTPALAQTAPAINAREIAPPPFKRSVEEFELQKPQPAPKEAEFAPYTEPVLEPKEILGVLYATGGVGIEEVEALKMIEDQFNLRIISSMKSGEFLSSTQVSIYDTEGALVFEAPMAGPYLYAKLPQGKYRIEARQYQDIQEKPFEAKEGLRTVNLMW